MITLFVEMEFRKERTLLCQQVSSMLPQLKLYKTLNLLEVFDKKYRIFC